MGEPARPSPFPHGMPYFTDKDTSLVRSLGTRDPLGFLPVWSAFARQLVPNVASPVVQVDGIKAVLLILWLGEDAAIADEMLRGADSRRRFFRLMEGLIEYWLYSNGRAPCYGSNTLRAEEDQFALTADSGKTVANGLYQYYRGTCRRAGFVGNDWMVEGKIAQELRSSWRPAATTALILALTDPLTHPKTPLIPAAYLDRTALSAALGRVFAPNVLSDLFKQRLFGCESQRDLARQFLQRQIAAGDMPLHENIRALQSATLTHNIRCVLDCEPFLLVMQDVFDMLRASGGKELGYVAGRLEDKRHVMAERASTFLRLEGEQGTGRMRRMQVLAAGLAASVAAASPAAARDEFIHFMRELVDFHLRCMAERGRDPLVIIEGTRIVSLVPDERGPQEAIDRLSAGFPWMNDYYFRTTSRLYGQLFGVPA
jgi:hypothetical protein